MKTTSTVQEPSAEPRHLKPVAVVGIGSYAPEKVLTNHDLEAMVDTTDEWIVTRTGVKARHIAAEGVATSDLGTEAARRALANAGVEAKDVDLIITATTTPDMMFPCTAALIQHKIGAPRSFCFDLEAACSGFIYGLEVGRQFVASGTVRTALVIGAEKMSSVVDWKDRTTCVLFGDGAAAAVLQPAATGRGIMASALGSDGSLGELLKIPAGGSRHPASEETLRERMHFIRMSGREVFKNAVTNMCRTSIEALQRCGLTAKDVTWAVPHQANLRIISALAEKLGVPMDHVVVNLEEYGNTSSASIGLALDEAVRAGRVKPGDVILLTAFGAGLTWGSMVLEWGGPAAARP